MGFFKGLKNLTKSAMGDSSAMLEYGEWMLKNNRMLQQYKNIEYQDSRGPVFC